MRGTSGPARPAARREPRGQRHARRGGREGSRKRGAGAWNLARRCQLLEQRGKGKAGEHRRSVSTGAGPRESDLLEEPAQPGNDERRGLVTGGGNRTLEVGPELEPERGVLFGTRDELIERRTRSRQLLRRAHPSLGCRRKEA